MKILLAALLTTLLLVPAASHATVGPRIVLNKALMTNLDGILQASEELHHALVADNEDQIEIGLRDVVAKIEATRRATATAKDYERPHLLRVIDAAQTHFDAAVSAYGTEKQLHIQEGINQIVNLVRIYRVDRSYGIFFCDKDRMSWVQRGTKAQDPFRAPASAKSCGVRVPDR